jgi:transcriptional regulator
MKDAYAKNRKAQPQGAAHVNAKLTTQQVVAIRKAYDKGQTQMKLAAAYGVSQRAISLIVRKETYK